MIANGFRSIFLQFCSLVVLGFLQTGNFFNIAAVSLSGNCIKHGHGVGRGVQQHSILLVNDP